jgi:hypothetical protein
MVLTTTTTIVEAVDVYNEIEKKRYQASLLFRHHMCLCKEDFALLVESNLMDELVKLVEDVDRSKKMLDYANRFQTDLPKDTDESEKMVLVKEQKRKTLMTMKMKVIFSTWKTKTKIRMMKKKKTTIQTKKTNIKTVALSRSRWKMKLPFVWMHRHKLTMNWMTLLWSASTTTANDKTRPT